MKKGFTLAELVIGIAIIMTAAGFGIANQLNFSERQILEQAGKNMVNALQEARISAQTGTKDENVCGTDPMTSKPMTGWCFSPQAGGGYKIYGGCSADPTPAADVDIFKEKDYVLPEDIEIESYDQNSNFLGTGSDKLVFWPLAKGVGYQDSNDNAITYCLGSSAITSLSALRYKIQVQSGGEILDYGIVSQTDCR